MIVSLNNQIDEYKKEIINTKKLAYYILVMRSSAKTWLIYVEKKHPYLSSFCHCTEIFLTNRMMTLKYQPSTVK